jgi:hypothetical protein
MLIHLLAFEWLDFHFAYPLFYSITYLSLLYSLYYFIFHTFNPIRYDYYIALINIIGT